MKNDKFILDLFLGELRSNCAIIKTAFNADADCAILENVARSLKSSAKLVGFVELAALFAHLEDFFAHKNLFVEGDNVAQESVKIIETLSNANSENIESIVDTYSDRIDFCANANFQFRVVASITNKNVHTDKFEHPKIDASMKELFVLDVSKQIELILNTLVELENDFTSKTRLEALMRSSHSIKGASRAVGLGSIVELTHQMENCFSGALNGKINLSENSIDVFFKCADFILELCKNSFSEIDSERNKALILALKSVEEHTETSKEISSVVSKVQSDVVFPLVDSSYVRISVDNINSIMALAAEELIETRKFERFKDRVLSIKQEQEQISNRLEEATNMLDTSIVESSALSRFEFISVALREQISALRNTIDDFSEYARKNVLLSSKLYHEVLESRMRPFSDIAQRFPKMVRDFSKSLSKKISFEISGATVSIDRDILEKLDAPITHILRNACDHGIELPSIREELGKHQIGKISMKASHSSGMFLLSISDDGRGIDIDKVKEKILAKKLVSEDILAQMQEDEIFEFLFLPAFTTKDEVTEISGRGVGLDVVQTMLREVGGSVSMTSEKG
ncbi:MAG: Hpt domain-containing protein, partial [Opitutales bacterium]|nr:Hpt domain-containing protein [Opitutales bacterium]